MLGCIELPRPRDSRKRSHSRCRRRHDVQATAKLEMNSDVNGPSVSNVCAKGVYLCPFLQCFDSSVRFSFSLAILSGHDEKNIALSY